MKTIIIQTVIVLLAVSCTNLLYAEEVKQQGNKKGGGDWTAEEYSGSRSAKDLRNAIASKGFAWLSGSPADNEKLSIGKNAQYFGFVALRYESKRAANRGALGRAFFTLINAKQQAVLPTIVLAEEPLLNDWWAAREELLRLYESYLYTGELVDEKKIATLSAKLARLGALIAVQEARGFAALEDSLSDEQLAQLTAWRKSPDQVKTFGQGNRVAANGLEGNQIKQLENLYAKAFSWITGTARDNEIIPLGQPAQFFGFVSIRHKSGHGASRGKIAKSFLGILDSHQKEIVENTIRQQMPVVKKFLEYRHQFLAQLALLRTKPSTFDEVQALKLAGVMGDLEVEAGWIEAKAYRKIREMMTDEQVSMMMKLRGNYVLNKSQIESLTLEERGQQLAMLCVSCHGEVGKYQAGIIGPTLEGVFDRPIASANGYQYSAAFNKLRGSEPWTAQSMDRFLAAPKNFAPGTKMEFQGLLNVEDRQALIRYLMLTR